MYNRTGFLLKKKSDSERERWVAQQQQLKKKKEREKKVETSPPFIMRCVLLWHFPTLFYIYTHVATQSSYIRRYMYVRLLWCIYIYKHREREPKMVGWWPAGNSCSCSADNHSFQSYHSSDVQTASCRYFIVISLTTCLWWPNDRIPMTNHCAHRPMRIRLGRFPIFQASYNSRYLSAQSKGNGDITARAMHNNI